MPRLRSLLPNLKHSWTKLPNYLLDKLLPSLKDTELRVLLVILRQTAGWNKTGAATILSYRQLKKRTGRESEAIAKAIRDLEARGLIHRPTAKGFRSPKWTEPEIEQQQYKDKS